jgi:hypothetical protein
MLTVSGPLEPTSETTPGGNINIQQGVEFFKRHDTGEEI